MLTVAIPAAPAYVSRSGRLGSRAVEARSRYVTLRRLALVQTTSVGASRPCGTTTFGDRAGLERSPDVRSRPVRASHRSHSSSAQVTDHLGVKTERF